MSQQDIDAISETAKARRKALEFDDFDNRQKKFAEAMRAAAQLETDRHKFIIQAFRRGRSGEWRLDDEAIRPVVLQLLHEFYDRPQHSSADLQAQYEDSIGKRDAGVRAEPPTPKIAPDEYEGFKSSTFANACREADQKRTKKTTKLAAKGRLPKSLTDAVDFLLKENDTKRLQKFLKGRSEAELKRIEKYISWKTSK
jgi:hypothetical protein